MGSFGQKLTPTNYSVVFGMAVDLSASIWEEIALSQRYTEVRNC